MCVCVRFFLNISLLAAQMLLAMRFAQSTSSSATAFKVSDEVSLTTWRLAPGWASERSSPGQPLSMEIDEDCLRRALSKIDNSNITVTYSNQQIIMIYPHDPTMCSIFSDSFCIKNIVRYLGPSSAKCLGAISIRYPQELMSAKRLCHRFVLQRHGLVFPRGRCPAVVTLDQAQV